MADKITTLKLVDDPETNIYPNVKDENIPETIQRKLTTSQLNAVNSGITRDAVSQIQANENDIGELKTSKQDVLTDAQLNAVNSGITNTIVQQVQDNEEVIAGKQDTLVSGTNIKTVNGNSLLGSGDITIESGSGSATYATDEEIEALFN